MGRALGISVVLAVLAVPRIDARDPALVVIVHPSRMESLDLSDVARIYLRKRRLWADGTAIVPLNREAGSGPREVFSVRVLGARTAELASYWNRAYFDGVFPPAVLSSGGAVVRYVANEPRAIGYVAPEEVDGSVRVVLTLD
jgi:ABC-type phosphate transport system substrate-binding protein